MFSSRILRTGHTTWSDRPLTEREQHDALAAAGVTDVATRLRANHLYYMIAAVLA